MRPRRVFVVNEPLKTNAQGEKGRAIDLRPAQRYGELIFLSPAGEPALDPSAWLSRMRELLSTFKPGDYLLPVGHPALIVAAAMIIGYLARDDESSPHTPMEELCVLVWGGRETGYAPVALPLNPLFPPTENQPSVLNPQSPESV